MKLLDSNILIYASKPGYEFLLPFVAAPDVCVSGISYVEVLGYHRLTDTEREPLANFFANTPLLPVSSAVLEKAVELRRERKLNLGDSLIAATALIYQCTLVTRNTEDFKSIPNLSLFNPFQNGSNR